MHFLEKQTLSLQEDFWGEPPWLYLNQPTKTPDPSDECHYRRLLEVRDKVMYGKAETDRKLTAECLRG